MLYYFTLMTTVVTGASGHVGANLVRALVAKGQSVRAMIHVDRRGVDGLPVEIAGGDVLDPSSLDRAFEGADTVYHLAASISLGDTRGMKTVNAMGTKNVVEASLRKRVKRLVHFSSIHAVDHSRNIDMIDESCPLVEPLDCRTYDRSKACAEQEVRRGIEAGLDAVIVRPTAMLGPYDYRPSFFGELLLGLARGHFPGLVAGGFDWVDVRDVVSGALRAEETAPPAADYLLSGHWATLKDVAAMIDQVTKNGVPGFVSPIWLARVAAPFATAFDRVAHRRALFTSFSIDTIRTSKVVSHQKASLELGYQPRPLEASIEDTLKWFIENGRLSVPGVSEVQG